MPKFKVAKLENGWKLQNCWVADLRSWIKVPSFLFEMHQTNFWPFLSNQRFSLMSVFVWAKLFNSRYFCTNEIIGFLIHLMDLDFETHCETIFSVISCVDFCVIFGWLFEVIYHSSSYSFRPWIVSAHLCTATKGHSPNVISF